MKAIVVSAILALGINVSAQMTGFSSQYSTLDMSKCSNFSRSEGGDTATCIGPQGIKLEMSAGDWSNIQIVRHGRSYETWTQMMPAGMPKNFGGTNKLAEWIFKNSEVHSLIVRTNLFNPNTSAHSSLLMVYGFQNNSVCLRGSAQSNQMARQMAETLLCAANLKSASINESVKISTSSDTTATNPSVFKKVRANSIQHLSTFISVDGVRMVADGINNSIALQDETRVAIAEFEILVNYCGYSRLKAELQPIGPGKSSQEVLGGSLSTYMNYPMEMGVVVPAGHVLPTTDLCGMV